MTIKISRTLFAFCLVFASFQLVAAERIKEFRGSRNTDTLEFEVRAPWILDWRVVTDYPGQMAVDISAGRGAHRRLPGFGTEDQVARQWSAAVSGERQVPIQGYFKPVGMDPQG